MNLSENYRDIICNEIDYVIEKIEKSKDLEEANFYLSAIHSIISRIFNIEFDDYLLFIHFVLSNSHLTISRAIELSKQRKYPIIINRDFFVKLNKLLNELKELIKSSKESYKLLQKIILLVYSTTGNGYYLKEKGCYSITGL